MKTNFGKLITDSFNFTWKYKVLWIFGFLMMLLTGASNFSNGFPDESSSRGSRMQNPDFTFINESNYLIFGLLILGVVLVMALVSWYLSAVSRGAILRSVRLDDDGQSSDIKFKKLFSIGNQYVMKVILFDLLWVGVILLFSIILVIPLVMLGFLIGPFVILLVCCGLLFLLPILFLIGVIRTNAEVLLIYYDKGIWESNVEGWTLIQNNFLHFFLAFLINIGLAIPMSVISFILYFITVIPSVLLILFLITLNNAVILVLVTVLLIIVVSLITAAIYAPFIVFYQVYWTKVVTSIKNFELS